MGDSRPSGPGRPGNVPRGNGYFLYSSIGVIDYKKSFYNGMLMTTGILGTTFVLDKCCGQTKYTPNLHMKDYFSLATVTILSQMAIDYGKSRGSIPSGLR